jgi:uncharacterized membrane protein
VAGIGIKLQKIYEKKTILAYLTGFGYSAVVTVAPMFVVIGTIMLMSQLLGYENVGYDCFPERCFISLSFHF